MYLSWIDGSPSRYLNRLNRLTGPYWAGPAGRAVDRKWAVGGSRRRVPGGGAGRSVVVVWLLESDLSIQLSGIRLSGVRRSVYSLGNGGDGRNSLEVLESESLLRSRARSLATSPSSLSYWSQGIAIRAVMCAVTASAGSGQEGV
jgi:hypothetical protein